MSAEQDNQEDKNKKKKRLVQADRSLAASVISIKCERCGQYYYKDQGHVCR